MTEKHFHRKGEQLQPPYSYKGCGLDGIFLLNGYDIYEDEDGKGVIIHNLDGLHEAIAMHLVLERKVLDGNEIRFLRVFMDMTQRALAGLLGCDSQTEARWEKDEHPIPGPADRLLRLLVLSHVCGDINATKLAMRIEELDSRSSNRVEFRSVRKNWKTA